MKNIKSVTRTLFTAFKVFTYGTVKILQSIFLIAALERAIQAN